MHDPPQSPLYFPGLAMLSPRQSEASAPQMAASQVEHAITEAVKITTRLLSRLQVRAPPGRPFSSVSPPLTTRVAHALALPCATIPRLSQVHLWASDVPPA